MTRQRVWSVVMARDETLDADAALELRAARGERDALAQLLREHTPALVRFATTYVPRHEAPDMAQRALERIVKSIAHFDPARGRFRTWAIAITRNLCIDHIRKRRELLSHSDVQPDRPDLAPHGDPARSLEGKEQIAELQRAMHDLPEGTRAALMLFHVHGESYDSIAQILNVPRGTVMTWLHRGRKQLKGQLQKDSE